MRNHYVFIKSASPKPLLSTAYSLLRIIQSLLLRLNAWNKSHYSESERPWGKSFELSRFHCGSMGFHTFSLADSGSYCRYSGSVTQKKVPLHLVGTSLQLPCSRATRLTATLTKQTTSVFILMGRWDNIQVDLQLWVEKKTCYKNTTLSCVVPMKYI